MKRFRIFVSTWKCIDNSQSFPGHLVPHLFTCLHSDLPTISALGSLTDCSFPEGRGMLILAFVQKTGLQNGCKCAFQRSRTSALGFRCPRGARGHAFPRVGRWVRPRHHNGASGRSGGRGAARRGGPRGIRAGGAADHPHPAPPAAPPAGAVRAAQLAAAPPPGRTPAETALRPAEGRGGAGLLWAPRRGPRPIRDAALFGRLGQRVAQPGFLAACDARHAALALCAGRPLRGPAGREWPT